MPIHDWTRGHDCLFHSFHLGWIVALCERLNRDVLPPSHFAMNETIELRPPVDFCVLPEPDQPVRVPRIRKERQSVDEGLPGTRFCVKRDRIEYADQAVTIRSTDTHAVEAAILVVSRQDREIGYRWESFLRHAIAAMTHHIHLLVVDLFPPNRRNPQGIHQAIWDRLGEKPFIMPPDEPLTLASYSCGTEIDAYIEPVAVGDEMPDMPLFLAPGVHVRVPLEATYRKEWDATPEDMRTAVETGILPDADED